MKTKSVLILLLTYHILFLFACSIFYIFLQNSLKASDGGAGITQSLPQSTNVNLNISNFEANLSTAADYKPNRIGTLKQTGHNKLKLKRKFSELDGD